MLSILKLLLSKYYHLVVVKWIACSKLLFYNDLPFLYMHRSVGMTKIKNIIYVNLKDSKGKDVTAACEGERNLTKH